MARNRRRKRKDDGPATLGRIFTKLTHEERAVIVHCLKDTRRPDFHLGMLPFVPFLDAITALRAGQSSRFRSGLSDRIIELMGSPSVKETCFTMYLNPAKVRQHFGKNPEIGKPLPVLGTLKVTAGMKWSLPKKMYVPDDNVQVHPAVTLQPEKGSTPRLGAHRYRVYVLSTYRAKARQWLHDHCA